MTHSYSNETYSNETYSWSCSNKSWVMSHESMSISRESWLIYSWLMHSKHTTEASNPLTIHHSWRIHWFTHDSCTHHPWLIRLIHSWLMNHGSFTHDSLTRDSWIMADSLMTYSLQTYHRSGQSLDDSSFAKFSFRAQTSPAASDKAWVRNIWVCVWGGGVEGGGGGWLGRDCSFDSNFIWIVMLRANESRWERRCNTLPHTATSIHKRMTHNTIPCKIRRLQCVAVCCIVLQCVAVCCSVLQCVAVCCSVLQCVAMYDTQHKAIPVPVELHCGTS